MAAPAATSAKLNWAERIVVNNPLRAFVQRVEIRLLKDYLDLGGSTRVLEVGCGRGAGARLLREELGAERIVATDLDPEMLFKARRYLTQQERERVRLAAADVLQLPFPDANFGAVFAFGVLHHVPDWRTGLSEIHRVLQPGGIYFLEEIYPSLYQNAVTRHILLHPEEDRFKSNDLKEALAQAGFTVIGAREVAKVGIIAVVRKRVSDPPPPKR